MKTKTAKQTGLLIINKSGYLGGSSRTKNVQDNEDNLEPMYPLGIRKIEEDQEEEETDDLEPMLPSSVNQN